MTEDNRLSKNGRRPALGVKSLAWLVTRSVFILRACLGSFSVLKRGKQYLALLLLLLLLCDWEIGRQGVVLRVRPPCTLQQFNLKNRNPASKVAG